MSRLGARVTREEASRILAVHVATVDRMIRRGVLVPGRRFATAQLSREAVERLALTTRSARRLIDGEDSYWVSRSGAARVMQLSDRRVQQLSDAEKLPYVTHAATGWRLYRREQVAVIGNARLARRTADHPG